MQNQVLGKYRIERELARGGMGVISLAYDTLCHRYVALKQIRPEVKKQKGAVERFLNEARVTASLTHPGIIGVYDICDRGVDSYYTMPYLQGKSLRQYLLEARAHPARFCISSALNVFLSVACAIEYAHSQNVVHRDIKADNIWLLNESEVVILDWGAAKRLDEPVNEDFSLEEDLQELSQSQQSQEEPDLSIAPPPLKGPYQRKAYQALACMAAPLRGPTSSHFDHRPSASSVVGTLNYMAPERIFREKASFATEVYSLGVLLYFMTSLQLPFMRKSFRKCRQTLHKEIYIPPHKKAIHRSIPWAVVEIINKALAKDPSERFQTVKELIHEVKQFQEHRSSWRSKKEFSPSREQDWLEKSWQKLPFAFLDERGRAVDLGHATRMQAPFSLNGQFEVHCQIQSDQDARGVLLHFDPHALLHTPSNIERLYFKKNSEEPDQRSSSWLVKLREHLLKEPRAGDSAKGAQQCEGIMIWISGREEIPGALIRDGVTILSLPSFQLEPGKKHSLKIENKDQILLFHFDSQPPVSYISPIPLVSMPFSLWVLPGHFSHFHCTALGGHLRLEGSCLDLPDYLFAKGRYYEAIEHYENIRFAFSDYQEGIFATFRCALAWVALAKEKSGLAKEQILDQAVLCLNTLSQPHSLALQWLGKSLVYRTQGELEDEAKALEMAYLRAKKNPLLEKVDEEVIFRLQQSAEENKLFFLQLMLCICRSRQALLCRNEVRSLFSKVLSQLPSHYIWNDVVSLIEEMRLVQKEDRKLPEELIIKLTLFVAFQLERPEVIAATIGEKLQKNPSALSHSFLIELWMRSLLSLQEIQAPNEAIAIWKMGKHLAQEKELMVASYQIAYPCGTFWLQERFALTRYEKQILCVSMEQAYMNQHRKMYAICTELEATIPSNSSGAERLEAESRSKIVISSHLLFGNKPKALTRFYEDYSLLPLDFRAFINALLMQEKREYKKAVTYIEGLFEIEDSSSHYLLWGKVMLLIYPESSRCETASLSDQIQEVLLSLEQFKNAAPSLSRQRFLSLMKITEIWAPQRFSCIATLYPVISEKIQKLSENAQIRAL